MENQLTFAEKNNLVVQHQDADSFYKDLELFKKHLPAHELNRELANANQFSYLRLDGYMLNELLNIIPIDEILENRKENEKEPEQDPPEVKTIDNIKEFLIAEFAFTDEDFEIIGEDYLQFLTSKQDEEIKTAILKFAALHPKVDDDPEDDEDEQLPEGEENQNNVNPEIPQGEEVNPDGQGPQKESELTYNEPAAYEPEKKVENETKTEETVKADTVPVTESTDKKKGRSTKNSHK